MCTCAQHQGTKGVAPSEGVSMLGFFSNRGERTIFQSDSRWIPVIHQSAEFVEIVGIAVCFNQERKTYKEQAVAADGVVAHEPEVQPPKEHQ